MAIHSDNQNLSLFDDNKKAFNNLASRSNSIAAVAQDARKYSAAIINLKQMAKKNAFSSRNRSMGGYD